MGFLKKIRNNILNQQNSFHVGFGNRSPFSYRGAYAGDWTPEVPNLAASAYGRPETDLGETDLLKAQIDTIGKVRDAVTGVAQAHIKNEAKKDCTGAWDAKNEKCISKDDSANNEYYQNIFAQKSKKYELTEDQKKEKEIEEAKRKKQLETGGVPDFTNFTGTSSDWH